MFSGWGFILHTFTVSTRQQGRSLAGAGGLASTRQHGAHTRCSRLWLFSRCSLYRLGWFIPSSGRKRAGEQPQGY